MNRNRNNRANPGTGTRIALVDGGDNDAVRAGVVVVVVAELNSE